MTGAATESFPRVGIVVLNYRNWADTAACLRSLAAATYPRTFVVVVDNDSGNDSLARIRADVEARGVACAAVAESDLGNAGAFPEPVLLVQAAANRGYAAGNNLGIRAALARNCEYVLVLNNDTEVEPGFLEPLVAYAEAHPHLGAVGPKVVDPKGRVEPTCARRRPELLYYFFGDGVLRRWFPRNRWRRRHFYEGEYAYDAPRQVDVLSGSCMLVKKAVFAQVGLLDENTFLYLEEFILHEKMRAAGWGQAIVPASVVVHKGGRSAGQAVPERIRQAKRESRRYYLTRYRRYGKFLVWVIELARNRPPAFGRRARKAGP
jgi:GT2 family glycosyltransferase